MNNSDITAVSAGARKAKKTYVYPVSWEDSTDELLENVPSFSNVQSIGERAVLQSSSASSTDDVVRERCMEAQPKRNDLGFWLLHGSVTRYEEWERILGVPQSVVEVRTFGLRHVSFAKRGCDFIGSLFLLIALLPLFGVIAILIKLDSPGPVFFRHYRVGRGGKKFMLWKFRSMRTNVPRYETSPRSVGDIRLTRVGRFIRRMSIDEIPQLINVLRGEMSFVGPRPEMPFIVARYHPIDCGRLSARPGITGLWQISPARAFPIHENLQYDLHYIRNQNIFLDCVILLRTITAIIHGIGAV